MKTKTILILLASITLFVIPTIAIADGIAWSSATYRAYAYAKVYEGIDIYVESQDEQFSPSNAMPMNASAYAADWNGESGRYSQDVYGDAGSSVSNSSFNVSVSALSW